MTRLYEEVLVVAMEVDLLRSVSHDRDRERVVVAGLELVRGHLGPDDLQMEGMRRRTGTGPKAEHGHHRREYDEDPRHQPETASRRGKDT